MSNILCNKFLCFTETYILYELDKLFGITTVKKKYGQHPTPGRVNV